MIRTPDGAWLTVKEASKAAGVSVPRVYQWIDEGRLKPVELGKRIRHVWGEDVMKVAAAAKPGRRKRDLR